MNHKLKREKLIIGITGEICAGKDTLAHFVATTLRQEGIIVSVFRTSDILREIFATIRIEPRRIDFHNMTEFLRHHYGEDILTKVMKHRFQEEIADVVLWVGLRSPYDIQALDEFPNSGLFFVEATPETRFGRIVQRNENRDDKEKTWETFLQDCEQSTERTIRSFRSHARLVINNEDNKLAESQQLLLKEVKKILNSLSQ